MIAELLDQGELVALEVRRRGLTGLFGKYRDDPTLREICEQAYQDRDAGGAEWRRSTPKVSRFTKFMSDKQSVRDTGTCLGGFLGMFLGAMLGFAICMKFLVDKVARNDGEFDSNLALLAFLGVMATGCIGAVGAVLIRLVFAAYTMVFSLPGEKRRGER